MPTVAELCMVPVYLQALISEASTTTAVPCWSSCMTGMSIISCRRFSISKHSGAAISSSWMAPKLWPMLATVETMTSGSLESMRIGMPLTPARLEKSSALPSITGIPARGPMSPRPSTAVPLVTMATVSST